MSKNFENITFVFDVDDTICNNKNRDYENAIPFKDVIAKIDIANPLHPEDLSSGNRDYRLSDIHRVLDVDWAFIGERYADYQDEDFTNDFLV